jgi:hypothetical protein
MRDYKETYTRLVKIIGDGYSLGEHSSGIYIEFPGNGFERICFEYEKTSQNIFSLAIFAGNTCTQARKLYKHFSYAKVIDLEKGGSTVESDFHFMFQSRVILSTKGDKELALSEYIDYWRWALSERYVRKYDKKEFGLLLKRMWNAKVMDDRDIADFNEYFRTRKYQSVITCPGIVNRISYSKERLNEDIESLAAELKEKMMFLAEIYG